MGITNAIAKYIEDNRISITQVVADTGIQIEKFDENTTEILSAQEMLRLCAYLRVKPEDIAEKYHDYI